MRALFDTTRENSEKSAEGNVNFATAKERLESMVFEMRQNSAGRASKYVCAGREGGARPFAGLPSYPTSFGIITCTLSTGTFNG